MAQRTPQNPSWQSHLPIIGQVMLLLVFLSVRGLVPAGFMPAPLASGTPYGLCHGDSRSALLLDWLSRQNSSHQGLHSGHHTDHQASHLTDHQTGHQAGHEHDAVTAKSFADSHCSFSASAAAAVSLTDSLAIVRNTPRAVVPASHAEAAQSPTYLRPPKRAPPVFQPV